MPKPVKEMSSDELVVGDQSGDTEDSTQSTEDVAAQEAEPTVEELKTQLAAEQDKNAKLEAAAKPEEKTPIPAPESGDKNVAARMFLSTTLPRLKQS